MLGWRGLGSGETLRLEPRRDVATVVMIGGGKVLFSFGPPPKARFGSGRVRVFSSVSSVGVHHASIGVVLSRACLPPSQLVAEWCHDADVKKRWAPEKKSAEQNNASCARTRYFCGKFFSVKFFSDT